MNKKKIFHFLLKFGLIYKVFVHIVEIDYTSSYIFIIIGIIIGFLFVLFSINFARSSFTLPFI